MLSPRGRFLWIRVTLASSDGLDTPSIRAIRAYYPRLSWLNLLPTAYRRDTEAAAFTDRFLALFEHVFTGVEDRYVEFSRELNPDAAPRDVIDWLGALIDLAFDPSWPLARRRELVMAAAELFAMRGTIAGLERYIEIYTGVRPVIVEAFLERPGSSSFLGRPGSVLGHGLPLVEATLSPGVAPDAALWARYAHRFTIYVYIDDACDDAVTLAVVNRIVEVSKPAHTSHSLEVVYPDARLGIQSRVGLDLVLRGCATDPARQRRQRWHTDGRFGAPGAACSREAFWASIRFSADSGRPDTCAGSTKRAGDGAAMKGAGDEHERQTMDPCAGDFGCLAAPAEFVRLRYFFGQRLGVIDFVDEQSYVVGKLRLHNRLAHGVGVLCGLQATRFVYPQNAPTGTQTTLLRVSGGVALDPFGREIVVGWDQCIDVAAWYVQHPAAQITPFAARATDTAAVDTDTVRLPPGSPSVTVSARAIPRRRRAIPAAASRAAATTLGCARASS